MARESDSGGEQERGSELPPVKELYFELRGREFLSRSGYAAFFEETKTLPFFDEIHQAWQTAIRNFEVGTPKGLKADSTAEQEQLELFFIELRHGDLSVALQKHASLIQKHSKDPVFRATLAQTINRPSIPNDKGLSLPYYVLCGWIHGFLWGLSNDDRVDLLRRAYGVTIHSAVGDESEVVRKTIARLKLKSWSDYRDVYSKPPFELQLFREGEQELCQIALSSTGQS